MRCKKHTVDFSSSIGVCASCLRERLFSLAASTAVSEDNHHRPLVFPRSVSPYVSARKSDAGRGGAGGGGGGGGGGSLPSSTTRFFATPQVSSSYGGGDSSSSEKTLDSNRSFKKKQNKLSRFSSLFRTRSEEFQHSRHVSTFSPPSSSRSWLSKVLSVRSKKPSPNTTCYIEDLIAAETRPRQRHCRGMSPAGDSESGEVSPGRVKRTPAIETPGRRKTAMMIGTGMSFCLSPLVRAKPNSSAKFGYSESPARPHLSTAASFCANRSKKLVDLGRLDPRR